jgi:hypothetical protein
LSGGGFPKEFSSDGRLLLDSVCNVWDLETGKIRFSVPGIRDNSSILSKDCRYLIVVSNVPPQCSLAYFDLSTGKEQLDRRLPLATGNGPGLHLTRATPDGRFLIADGTPDMGEPGAIRRWLAKVPGLQFLGTDQPHDLYVLIDAEKNREIMRGDTYASCTPDGRYVMTRTRNELYLLWNVPARKPLGWLLLSWMVWSIAVGLLAYWRLWRQREFLRSAAAVATAQIDGGLIKAAASENASQRTEGASQ